MRRSARRSALTTRLIAEQRAAALRYTALLDRCDQEGRFMRAELTAARERLEALLPQVWDAMRADIDQNPAKQDRNEFTRQLRIRIEFCNELLNALNNRFEEMIQKETCR